MQNNLIQMREAILHIGTEKTGSTAIQNYLLHNACDHIKHHGLFFPYKTCGLISNFRLVLFTKSEIDTNLANLDKKAVDLATCDANGYAAWKMQFSSEHTKAIKAFQSTTDNSKVVYSSEHFHSRVHDESDIARLKTYLDTLYDQITILLYMRRQDQFALSAYNTAVQGGYDKAFDFSAINRVIPYYDYLSLVQRWSNVFNVANVKPIIFDSNTLKNADVAKDFEAQIGIDEQKHDLSNMRYHKSNERLSYSALQVLIHFNLMQSTDSRLNGQNKEALRQPLIKEVQSLTDQFGTIRPARSEAVAFYAHYKSLNESLAAKWLNGKGFSPDFSMYPEHANAAPVVESDQLLTQALANLNL